MPTTTTAAITTLKRTRTPLLPVLALVVGLGATVAVQARGGPEGPVFKGAMMEAKLAQRLELDAEQRERSRAILDAARSEARPIAQTLVATKAEMRTLRDSGDFDEARVRAVAERRAAATVDMTVLEARVRAEMNALLRPEQREELAQMKHRRHDGHGRRHGGHEKK